jgi:catechol 2,3-dioxygenase-like lactoylglutathione lyase family enzyme
MPTGRAIAIGGVFLRSSDPDRLTAWYVEHLGLNREDYGTHFAQTTGLKTVWHVFPQESRYFEGPIMINYIVDDMDALLERLTAAQVKIDPKREEHEYGKFAWIYDPDGNKIELWQPKS